MHLVTTSVKCLRFCGTCDQSLCQPYMPLSKRPMSFQAVFCLGDYEGKGAQGLLA